MPNRSRQQVDYGILYGPDRKHALLTDIMLFAYLLLRLLI